MKQKAHLLAILGGTPAVTTSHHYTWPMITPATENHIVKTLRQGELNYGESSVTRDFEEAFAAYHNVKYALGTNSGTSALLLAFFACGLFDAEQWGEANGTSQQAEVLVPAYGFFATVSPLLYLGVKPVFCDVTADTGNLDPLEVARKITAKTRAVVVTHVAGHPAQLNSLRSICDQHDLPLIEDCSHAHGSLYRGRKVGTFGKASAFSLQTGKMVTGGEGGILLTDDEEVFRRAAALSNYRRLDGLALRLPDALQSTGLGMKLRISPLSAILAHYHLNNLESFIASRKHLLDSLTQRLNEQVTFVRPPVTYPHVTRGAYYEYPLRYPSKICDRLPLQAFKAALAAEGVIMASSNTRSVYKLGLFQLGLKDSIGLLFGTHDQVSPVCVPHTLPCSDKLEKETFVLPPFTSIPDIVIDEYAEAFERVCSQMEALIECYRVDPSRFKRGTEQHSLGEE